MKSIRKPFLSLLALALAFSLTACLGELPEKCTTHVDEDENGKCDVCDAVVEPEKEPEEKPQPEADGLVLIEDGEAKFQIVTATSVPSSAAVKKTVDNLKKTLKELGVEVDTVTESDKNAKDCEVIIGAPTTRGEAYEYDMHDLGQEGYLIKLIDGKIIIVGGSEEALLDAVAIFTEEFLGIDKKTKKLDTVVVKDTQNIEEIQDDYRVTALKLNGEDMKGYTIAVDKYNRFEITAAEYLQNLFYTRTGYWFEIVTRDEADKSIVISVVPNKYDGSNGFDISVTDTALVIETQFPDKLQGEVEAYFATNVTVKQGEIDFTHKTHKLTKNLREICYEDKQFGATNNGMADDDFKAMKACHDYANLWGHTVVGKSGSTYHIGKIETGESIIITTDVDWKNCKIILDDSQIGPDDKNANGTRLRDVHVFQIMGDCDYGTNGKGDPNTFFDITHEFTGKTLEAGAANIGYAPGFKAIVHILNNNVKHYIRYGVNENSGNAMQEVILIDEEGNVSEETPVVWTYETVTSARLYCIEDRPITLKNLKLDNIANQAPNYYTAYSRGITVLRSNTTVKGIDHSLLEEGPTRAPYQPTLNARYCYNVTFEDALLQYHQRRNDAGTGALLGTYELGGTGVIKITWRNCRQKNFFQDDGTIIYQGLFGSNYCRNALLEDCFLNSFDAHCGLTNATVRNSTFEHMNFIGNGDIVIENVTIYSDGTNAGLTLRTDYGSTWNGDVYIDGLHFKYMKNNPKLSIIKAEYTDWDFGYTCYFPQNITVKNVTSAKVAPTVYSSTRLETDEIVIEENVIPIHLCYTLEKISEDLTETKNDYQGTKTFTVTDCPSVPGWVLPNIPMFSDMRVYINGSEIVNWKAAYGSR